MKINYADYIKNTDASVLVAESIFSELELYYPLKFISEVAKTTSGGTPLRSNPDYYDGDIPWIKSGELNDGIIEKAEEFITQEGLINSSAKLNPPNTLLLAMYGATAGRTGKAKIAVSTNQAVCALFPKEEEIEQDFLFWFLRQYRYRFIEISKGGAQPNISQSVINQTKLPVPSKELQCQIVKILFELEANKNIDLSKVPIQFRAKVTKVFTSKNNVLKISDEITQQLNLLKKLRQQLLQDAVQGRLVKQNIDDEPAIILLQKIKTEKEQLIKDKKLKSEKELPLLTEENIPFDIPENWVWCKIGAFTTSIVPNRDKPLSFTGEIPWITQSNFSENSLKLNYGLNDIGLTPLEVNKYNCRKMPVGSIIMSCVGRFDLVCLVEKEIVANQQLHCFVPYGNVNPMYVTFAVKFFSKFVEKDAIHTTIKYINKTKCESIPIPLPPLAEQNRIVIKLEQLMQNCDALEFSIKQSQLKNEQLLQQVLREALTKDVELEAAI